MIRITTLILTAALSLIMSAIAVQAVSPPTTPTLEGQVTALQAEVTSLRAQLIALQQNNALKLGPFVTVDPNPQLGVIGPNITFTGANIHIVNGTLATATVNGLGNLIIGYDETTTLNSGARNGSHNLVVVSYNNFATNAYGGVVFGSHNAILSYGDTVLGGYTNATDGPYSTVVGGYYNEGDSLYSVVIGGIQNWTQGVQYEGSVIVGGELNQTQSSVNVILGGVENAMYSDTSFTYAVTLGGVQIQGQGVTPSQGYIFSGTVN
jgi:hypothetical protein